MNENNFVIMPSKDEDLKSKNESKFSNDFETLGFQTFEQYCFPSIINLSVIRGQCPCKCVHCPVGLTEPNLRNKRFGNSRLSLSLFKKIVLEMTRHRRSVLRIHGVGEPLIWDDLASALKFSYEKGVKTWLFTCLVTEDHDLLAKIARFCGIIEISVNSYEKSDYLDKKGINAFSLVKDNIEFLREFSVSNNYSTRIIVSRVESENKEYDLRFIDYWKSSGLVDDAFVRSYHDYNKLLAEKFWQQKKEISPCLVHWSRFNIDCNGTAVVCFNELFKGEYPSPIVVLGNIRDQSIQEIWQGNKLNSIRISQLCRDHLGIDFLSELPCINCSSSQPLNPKGRKTSEYQLQFMRDENTHE